MKNSCTQSKIFCKKSVKIHAPTMSPNRKQRKPSPPRIRSAPPPLGRLALQSL